MDSSWACFSSSNALEGLEALTKLLRKEDEEEGRAEPRKGTFSVFLVLEKPRPCLNLAAPSPFRVSSS